MSDESVRRHLSLHVIGVVYLPVRTGLTGGTGVTHLLQVTGGDVEGCRRLKPLQVCIQGSDEDPSEEEGHCCERGPPRN